MFLPGVSAQFNVSDIERDLELLGEILDEEIGVALTACARNVAETAQETHTFQNRTGDLERLTMGRDATGSFMDGTAQALVVADTFYAEHVESRPGYAFLAPALEESLPGMDAEMQDAADRTAARAGFPR